MKSKKIILCIMMLLLICTGCKRREALTKEEFTSIMENNNYTVTDNIANYISKLNIKEAYLASNDNYYLEYFIYDSTDTAKSYFADYQYNYEEIKEQDSPETVDNMGDTAKYTLIIDGRYVVLSRVNNSLIVVDVNDTFRREIKNILKELGY